MLQDINSPDWLKKERRWVKKARRGDRAAFAKIYQAFAQALYAQVLLPRLSDAQCAEDALAETFVVAWQRLEQFQHRQVSIWFWLQRIAKNKATDMFRARHRRAKAIVNYQGLLAPLQEEPEQPLSVQQQRQEDERRKRRIYQTLQKLNPRYQRVLTLRFLEDRPRQACAQQMGVRLGTLDVLVLRALRAFGKEWSRSHE